MQQNQWNMKYSIKNIGEDKIYKKEKKNVLYFLLIMLIIAIANK